MKSAFLMLVATVFVLAARPIDDTVTYIFPDEQPVVNLTEWKRMAGDSLAWSAPGFPDGAWPLDPGFGLWARDGRPGLGVCWYRKALFFPEPLDSLVTLALYQAAVVSASEIYWDGVLVAANGTVGLSRDQEVPGRSGQLFPIPRRLTGAGRHQLAMRVSNFHSFSGLVERPLQLGTFSSLHAGLMRRGAVGLFLAGVFLITALFHFAILLGQGNKWTYGLFSAFCFFCSVYIFIQTRLNYFQIDLRHYDVLAFINDIPWFFMIALLPMFFLYEFSFPLRNRLSAVIAATALLVVTLPRLVIFGLVPLGWLNALVLANQVHTYATFAVAIGVAVWASLNRKAGARTAAIGLVAFFVGVWVTYVFRVENGWAVGFAILILFLTVSLARHMAQATRRHQEAQLRSTRLELELLKKHIQPHFLLNSLNSIVAWLEEDPQTASRLVNALADELRLLLTFSGKPLITLAEEVHLCRAHLQVMGLRQEKEFALLVDCHDESVQLPPLIIHTLLENGLTHGYAGRNRGSFRLRCCREGQAVRVGFFNDGAVSAATRPDADGTGLRYVKSRLEEAFPGRWRLQAGPVAGGWEVTIEVEHSV